jgi:hypothetical protein
MRRGDAWRRFARRLPTVKSGPFFFFLSWQSKAATLVASLTQHHLAIQVSIPKEVPDSLWDEILNGDETLRNSRGRAVRKPAVTSFLWDEEKSRRGIRSPRLAHIVSKKSISNFNSVFEKH